MVPVLVVPVHGEVLGPQNPGCNAIVVLIGTLCPAQIFVSGVRVTVGPMPVTVTVTVPVFVQPAELVSETV